MPALMGWQADSMEKFTPQVLLSVAERLAEDYSTFMQRGEQSGSFLDFLAY